MKEKIGQIWADNRDDPLNKKSIEFGFWYGEGKLGEVLGLAKKLERAAKDRGYWGEEEETVVNELKRARLNFFMALKELEELTRQRHKIDQDAI